MHQGVPGVARVSVALQDTHPKRFEFRRLTEANDVVIWRTPTLCQTIDLLIDRPLCTRSAVGTQQSQIGAVDMEATTFVIIGSHEAQSHIALIADTEIMIRQPTQIDAPVTEG